MRRPLHPRTDAPTAADPETLAIAALSFLAGEPERLGRFLAVTGLGPETIREAATTPGFLVAVLDYLAGDESLLVAFAANAGIAPEAVAAAHARALSDRTESSE
ncbi:MAG: DUF3572 domain-containing protein [Pseudochelatococcus sp.]|jgi:hypothetical protein|uniref:DUF3572 domain-containing protein n=1 Tax=Pseudochelatococcus sp. TaxID=2020869 RepID=UPI003D8D35E4